MTRVSIAKQVEALIEDKLNEADIELVEVEYKKESNEQILRIYIDTENGIDLDACARASRSIKDIVDARDEICYDHMEVSSPGIDRILKRDRDFHKHLNEKIKIKTSTVVEGKKNFIGILLDANEDSLNIEIDGRPISIPRQAVSIVRLHPDI